MFFKEMGKKLSTRDISFSMHFFHESLEFPNRSIPHELQKYN